MTMANRTPNSTGKDRFLTPEEFYLAWSLMDPAIAKGEYRQAVMNVLCGGHSKDKRVLRIAKEVYAQIFHGCGSVEYTSGWGAVTMEWK